MATASFPFMKLPKAIRLMVYERMPREVKHVKITFPSFDEGILVHRFTHTAILATSRQVNAEASLYIGRILQHFILEQTPRFFVSNHIRNDLFRLIKRATDLQVNALDTGIVGYQLPGFAQFPYFPESQIEEANFRKFIQISARQILLGIRENRRRRAQHLAQHAGNTNPPDLELRLPGYEVVFLQHPHPHGFAADGDMFLAAFKIESKVNGNVPGAPPLFSFSLAGGVPRLDMCKFSPADFPFVLPVGLPSQPGEPVSVFRHITILHQMSEEQWKERWLE